MLLELGDEILILIWRYFQPKHLTVTAQVCRRFALLSSDNQIWRELCQNFHDFPHLRNKALLLKQTWKSIYRQRFCGIYKTREVLIGPREQPTDRRLIQLMGSGECYLSTHYEEIIEYYDSDLCPINDNITVVGNIRYYMQKITDCLTGTIRGIMIDVQTYDPHILLLNSSGQVFEFITPPEWATNWSKFRTPNLIGIPYPVKAIFCLAVGNFAITMCGKVYFWTITSDPSDDHAQTRMYPVHVAPLDALKVQKIEEGTEPHLVRCDNIEVDSTQLMYLLLEYNLNVREEEMVTNFAELPNELGDEVLPHNMDNTDLPEYPDPQLSPELY